MKKIISYFTLKEWLLYFCLIVINIIAFLVSSGKDLFGLFSSLLGITALAFLAKGNVIGQFLTIIFSTMYAFISFKSHYYGELITYAFMTAPIAVISIISWIRHPFNNNKNDVEINEIKTKEYGLMALLAISITVALYFALKYLGTDNIYISTLSVFTSFSASFLMLRRSRFYAIAYALNDIVLIILWLCKTIEDINYLPMVMCFLAFFIYDLIGFISWTKRLKQQQLIKKQER